MDPYQEDKYPFNLFFIFTTDMLVSCGSVPGGTEMIHLHRGGFICQNRCLKCLCLFSVSCRMDGSFEEVMLVDFEMDNFITLQVSHSILWRVEYPSTGETAESVTLVYVRQRDVLGIVPLAEVRELS